MPIDQHRATIEVKFLGGLFSKYATLARSSTLIRPLGQLRPASDVALWSANLGVKSGYREVEHSQRSNDMFKKGRTGSGFGSLQRNGTKSQTHPNLASGVGRERMGTDWARTDDVSRGQQGLSRSRLLEKRIKIASNGTRGQTVPGVASGVGSERMDAGWDRADGVNRGQQVLSRSRLLENRLKTVSQRDTPRPRTDPHVPRDLVPPTVRLPLLKVRLETLAAEDSHTLEMTRSSLRHLLSYSRLIERTQSDTPPQVTSPGGQVQTSGDRKKEAASPHRNADNAGPPNNLQILSDRLQIPKETICQSLRPSDTESRKTVLAKVNNESKESSESTASNNRRPSQTAPTDSRDKVKPASGTLNPENRSGVSRDNQRVPFWPSYEDIQNFRWSLGAACKKHGHLLQELQNKVSGHLPKEQGQKDNSRRDSGVVAATCPIPVLRYTTASNETLSKTTLAKSVGGSKPIEMASLPNVFCPVCSFYRNSESSSCPPNTPCHPEDDGDLSGHLNNDCLPSIHFEL